jgi:hypothetical protein
MADGSIEMTHQLALESNEHPQRVWALSKHKIRLSLLHVQCGLAGRPSDCRISSDTKEHLRKQSDLEAKMKSLVIHPKITRHARRSLRFGRNRGLRHLEPALVRPDLTTRHAEPRAVVASPDIISMVEP